MSQNPLEAHMGRHQPVITKDDLVFLFIHLLRCRSVYLDAKELLVPTHFNAATESHFAVMWAAAVSLIETYGNVTYSALRYEIIRRLSSDQFAVSKALEFELLREDHYGILYSIMNVPDQDLMPAMASDVLRRLLQERAVVRPLQQRLQQSHNSYPTDIAALMAEINNRVTRIQGIGVLPVASQMQPWGSQLTVSPQIYNPTGIGFIDRYIRGQRPGDCNGALGVFGAGKTTLAIQYCMSQAKLFWSANQQGACPLSVMVSYEEETEKLLPRLWSCAARIHRARIELLMGGQWSQLSRAGNLNQYDHDAQPDNVQLGMPVASEHERYEAASVWYNRAFVLVDMSGAPPFEGAGRGGVSELRAVLDRISAARGQPIGSVYIDYAKIMASRYMQYNNIRQDDFRFQIGGLGNKLREQIAIPMGATVWLAHQFAPDQNKRAPTTLLSHEDASESKSFAENMPLCMCLGVRDKGTGCSIINWSKMRYGAEDHTQLPPAIVKIDWRYSVLDDVSEAYTLDLTSRSIVDRQAANQLGGTSAIGGGPDRSSPSMLGLDVSNPVVPRP